MDKEVSIAAFQGGITVTYNESAKCKERCDYMEFGIVYTFEKLNEAFEKIRAFVTGKTCLQRGEDSTVKVVPTS